MKTEEGVRERERKSKTVRFMVRSPLEELLGLYQHIFVFVCPTCTVPSLVQKNRSSERGTRKFKTKFNY